MIVLIIGTIILIAATTTIIAEPLIRARWSRLGDGFGMDGPSESEELIRRRDRIYSELRELDFDYRVGKVTDYDYREGREQLEIEAARILQALDLEIRVVDEDIEREVQRLRTTERACPECGSPVTATAQFCPRCGTAQKVTIPR